MSPWLFNAYTLDGVVILGWMGKGWSCCVGMVEGLR